LCAISTVFQVLCAGPSGWNLVGRTGTLANKGNVTSGRCAGLTATAAFLPVTAAGPQLVNLIGTDDTDKSKHFCLQNLPIKLFQRSMVNSLQ
jgi:hypothetical protein